MRTALFLSSLLVVSCCWNPLVAQHPNDTCLNPAPVVPNPGVITIPFNTLPAQTESGVFEPAPNDPACVAWGTGNIVKDIWFRYVAQEQVTIFGTCPTTFDTKIEIYENTAMTPACPPSAMSLVGCADDGCGAGLGSQVSVQTAVGNLYYIRVGGWVNNTESGPGTLTIEGVTPFPNDVCTDAILLGTGTSSIQFDSTGATTEGGVFQLGAMGPTACTDWCCDISAGSDIWYRWFADSSLTQFSLCGGGTLGDSVIEVYTVPCPASFATLQGCDDDGCGTVGGLSTTTIPTIPGDQYIIRVGAWNGGPGGTGTLTVTSVADSVQNLTCIQAGGGNGYNLAFDWPAGAMTGDTIEITSTEPGVSNPLTTLNYTGSTAAAYSDLLLPANQGASIAVQFEVTYFTGSSVSLPEACTLIYNPAPGDECAGAPNIGSGDVVHPFDLSTATASPEPDPGNCGQASEMEEDSWFEWTATTEFVTIAVMSPAPMTDDVIALYASCAAATAGTELACNDGPPAPGDAEISVTVTVGATYLIRVANDDGMVGPGTLTIAGSQPVGGLTCSTSGDDFTLTWTNPAGGAATDTIDINSNEPGVFNPIATFSSPLPTMYMGSLNAMNAGTGQLIEFEVVYNGNIGPASATCDTIFNGPSNDDCSMPIDLGTGTVVEAWDNSFATTDSPDFGAVTGTCATWISNVPDQIHGDLWYLYTAGVGANEITVSLDTPLGPTGLGDTKLAVYDVTTCPADAANVVACDDDAGLALLSELTMTVTPGHTYKIQLGSWSTITRGAGTLTISPPCDEVSAFSVAYDCGTQVATISWTDEDTYSGLSLIANGTPTTNQPTPAGIGMANSVIDSPPANSVITYELTATCANGGTTVASVTIDTTQPTGAANLIIHLETPDNINSGEALETALSANGATVLRITDGAHPCIDGLIADATNVWVMLGTFPNSSALTTTLGDKLHAAVQTGATNVYIESSDHWVFDPASNFDSVDGVLDGLTADGNDDLDSLQAVLAVTAGLDLTSAFLGPVAYNQAQAGDDSNDQLELAIVGAGGDTDISSTEVIWRNDPDAGETNFVVGVTAVSGSGQRVICSSFEFGGIGGAMGTTTLAGLYLSYLSGSTDPKFQRGDCNSDNAKNIADPVRLLNFLFPAAPPPTPLKCNDSCDANDDGGLNIADAVAMLNVLFPTGPPIAWLAPDLCGLDPTPDVLDCLDYTAAGSPICP